jgi:hypothetical protein
MHRFTWRCSNLIAVIRLIFPVLSYFAPKSGTIVDLSGWHRPFASGQALIKLIGHGDIFIGVITNCVHKPAPCLCMRRVQHATSHIEVTSINGRFAVVIVPIAVENILEKLHLLIFAQVILVKCVPVPLDPPDQWLSQFPNVIFGNRVHGEEAMKIFREVAYIYQVNIGWFMVFIFEVSVVIQSGAAIVAYTAFRARFADVLFQPRMSKTMFAAIWHT